MPREPLSEDVEELKAQLEIAKRRLQASFLESVIPMAVVTKNRHRLVTCNHAAASFFGRPDLVYDLDVELAVGRRDESEGIPPEAIFSGDDGARFIRAVDEVASDREPPRDLRLRMRNGQGEERICALDFHRNTASGACVFAMRDVTELMRAQRELAATQAQLIQQGKMAALGTLVAGVAHDINTPLGSIKANTEMCRTLVARLAKKLPEGDAKVERASSALDDALKTSLLACERIGGIVGSLRNFVRLDESELKSVDLHAGLDSSLVLCEHLFKNRIEVVKRYGDLPEVRCNPGELNQVFMNLLTNAAQAISGRGTITVTTERVQGDRVVVTIADDGAGIDPSHLDRVFDPGFTTKGVGVGTGIGLSIAHRIVTDHGGQITVDSAPGRGARFSIALPSQGAPTSKG